MARPVRWCSGDDVSAHSVSFLVVDATEHDTRLCWPSPVDVAQFYSGFNISSIGVSFRSM